MKPPFTSAQVITLAMTHLGRQRWKGKTMAQKRRHAMMMVRARRKKLRERARETKGTRM